MTDNFDVNGKNIQFQNTVFVQNNAKLIKNDAADEFLRSFEEISGKSENKARFDPGSEFGDDNDGLEAHGILENELDNNGVIVKADLDKDGLSDDVFIDDEPLQAYLKNIIAGIKQLLTIKTRIAVSSVMATLLICIGILFFIFFPGTDQEKAGEIFADSAPVSEINESGNASFIENYEMKTFVIPMQDAVRERVFFKVDFIITINKVDLIQLKNNSAKIREAVYNQFYNKNSEIILNKLKRSEQMYKLKNVLNLLLKKETIEEIEIVDYNLY